MIEHREVNPYNVAKKLAPGRYAVSELCECGHRLDDHHDAKFGYGHGRCAVPECRCGQFTWIEFVVAKVE